MIIQMPHWRKCSRGYDIVDYGKPRPELVGNPVRSEATQAHYLTTTLDFFETQQLLGAFVYTCISPDSPSSSIPRHNLDTAAFSVVKVIREHELDPPRGTAGSPSRRSTRSRATTE